jgi:hypothetical protein
MINQPETQGPHPQQGKVILPGYTDHTTISSLNNTQIRPEQLTRHTTIRPPKGPFARLGYFWHKDAAHKVLMIAVGMVFIAGLLFASLFRGALLHNPNFFGLNSTFSQVPPTAIVPAGTVDLRPTFPSPGGGKGSSTSSQPPAQGTPALQPTTANGTPTVQPTQGGTLTVQIIGISHRVMNNSVVDVVVNANEANVSVILEVRYNAPPFSDSAGPSTTDANGNAIISWSVRVFKFGGAEAVVVAVATDQNGQQAQSNPVLVQIVGFGGN